MTTLLIDPTLRRARIVRTCLVFLVVFVVGTTTLFIRGLRAIPRAPLALAAPRRAAEMAGRRAIRGQRPVSGQRGARPTPSTSADRTPATAARPARRRALIAFADPPVPGALRSLARHSGARGLTVTVDVPAFLDDRWLRRLARAADRLLVMSYDEHDPDGLPGPIASDAFVAGALAAARAVPPGQLVVGLPIYGYDWTNERDAEAVSFVDAHAAAREARVLPAWDPSGNLRFRYADDRGTHDVWLTDAATLSNQLDEVARAGAPAVALWRLGGEDPGVWPLLEGGDAPSDVPPDPTVRNLGAGPFLSLAVPSSAGRRVLARAGERVTERWEASPSPFVVRHAGVHAGQVA